MSRGWRREWQRSPAKFPGPAYSPVQQNTPIYLTCQCFSFIKVLLLCLFLAYSCYFHLFFLSSSFCHCLFTTATNHMYRIILFVLTYTWCTSLIVSVPSFSPSPTEMSFIVCELLEPSLLTAFPTLPLVLSLEGGV